MIKAVYKILQQQDWGDYKFSPLGACSCGSPFPQSDSGSGFPSLYEGASHQQGVSLPGQDLFPADNKETTGRASKTMPK